MTPRPDEPEEEGNELSARSVPPLPRLGVYAARMLPEVDMARYVRQVGTLPPYPHFGQTPRYAIRTANSNVWQIIENVVDQDIELRI